MLDNEMVEVPMSVDTKALYSTEMKTNSDAKTKSDMCTVFIVK